MIRITSPYLSLILDEEKDNMAAKQSSTIMLSNVRSNKSTKKQQRITAHSKRAYSLSGNMNKIQNRAAQSVQLRNRYLRTLGIHNSSTDIIDAPISHVSPILRMSRVRTLREPLKRDDREYVTEHQAIIDTPNSPQSVMCAIEERPKRRVSFDSSVSVVPIPKRDEYSSRIKDRIWNSAIVIYENATRNALEFSTENWDWRQVREENDFFICVDTGESVHPAHAHLFVDVQTYGCGSSKHKDSFLQMSRDNAYEWQMRESQMYS